MWTGASPVIIADMVRLVQDPGRGQRVQSVEMLESLARQQQQSPQPQPPGSAAPAGGAWPAGLRQPSNSLASLNTSTADRDPPSALPSTRSEDGERR